MRHAWLILAACGAPPARPAPSPAAAAAAVPADAAADAAPDRCTTTDQCVALGQRILVAPATLAHDPAAASATNARALALFRAACAQDHPEGCEWVGKLLEDHPYYGLAQDAAGAAIAFDKACRLGNAHACYTEGFVIWEGLLDHIVDDRGTLRRIDWPADKRIGAKVLHHACDDLHEPNACKLLDDLRKAGVL